MTPDPRKGLCIREVWPVFVGVTVLSLTLSQRGSILHIKHAQRIIGTKKHTVHHGLGYDLHLELETFQTGIINDGASVHHCPSLSPVLLEY